MKELFEVYPDTYIELDYVVEIKPDLVYKDCYKVKLVNGSIYNVTKAQRDEMLKISHPVIHSSYYPENVVGDASK